MLPLLFIFFARCLALAPTSRVCDPTQTNPSYTGLRAEVQISFNDLLVDKQDVHYILCKEGRPITDMTMEFKDIDLEGVVWNTTICDSLEQTCYKLARHKNFALRAMHLFAPGNVLGGWFEQLDHDKPNIDASYVPIAPIISDSIFNQWLEIKKNSLQKIYHLPLLYTPDIDDRKFMTPKAVGAGNNSWFSSISANELYDYTIESRNSFQKGFDLILIQVKELIKLSNKKLRVYNEILSDSIPSKNAIKAKSKAIKKAGNALLIPKVFKSKIDELSKLRINKKKIDFGTLMILSKVLPKENFNELLQSFEQVYSKVPIIEEEFKYPKLDQYNSN